MAGLRRWLGSRAQRMGLAFRVGVGAAALTACNAISNNQDTPPSDIFDKVRGVDMLPRYPQQRKRWLR